MNKMRGCEKEWDRKHLFSLPQAKPGKTANFLFIYIQNNKSIQIVYGVKAFYNIEAIIWHKQ